MGRLAHRKLGKKGDKNHGAILKLQGRVQEEAFDDGSKIIRQLIPNGEGAAGISWVTLGFVNSYLQECLPVQNCQLINKLVSVRL